MTLDYLRIACGNAARHLLQKNWAFLGILFVLGAFVTAIPALAQTGAESGGLLPEIEVKGRGWYQVFNTEEMGEFLLALAETAAMTALITYHPVTLTMRKTLSDYELPKTLFMYSLIGMSVGFLVVHHGYLIGFVVFGLGGLLRFRSDGEIGDDKARLILATLIGLAIGLDLPVMGLILSISGWLIIYVLGRRAYFALEVRFSEKKANNQTVDNMQQILKERGFNTVSVTKSKFKPTAQYILVAAHGATREALLREMTEIGGSKDFGVADWHLD